MTRPDFSLEISNDTFDPNEAPSAVRAMPHPEPTEIAMSSLERASTAQTSLNVPNGAVWSAGLAPLGAAIAATIAFPKSRLARAGLASAVLWGGGVALFRWQMQRLFAPQPAYAVEKRFGRMEIRRYPAMVTAETTVFGASWRESISDAFARLAAYIGGENIDSEQLEMISPVSAQEHGREALPMNAPVTVRRDADNAVTLSFVMPLGRRASSLPRPIDTRVTLVAHAARRIAVTSFRGFFDGRTAREGGRNLIDRARTAGLLPRGEPMFAAYDPPTTLALLRREEVWVELA